MKPSIATTFFGGNTAVPFLMAVLMTLFTAAAPPAGQCASSVFQRALQAARSGDLDRSVDLWTTAIRRDPRCYAAYVNRGSALLMTGHIYRGVADWHKAKRYAPVFAYAFYSADFIDEIQRNRKMLAYTKPLEIDPEYTGSVTMLGAMCMDLGRTEAALKLYSRSKALTRNPLLKNYFDHWIALLKSRAVE